METLAFIESVLAYQATGCDFVLPNRANFFPRWHWNKFSSSSLIHWLSVAMTLALLNLATHALAFEPGQQGDSVRSIQQRLQQFGYFQGNITGFYGSVTESAVRRFQEDNNLPITGRVDADTLSTMGRLLAPPQNFGPITQVGSDEGFLSLGDRGLEVKILQQQLQALGYLTSAPTGEYDVPTRSAVIRFQRDYRLQESGIVGPTTRTLLEEQVLQNSARISTQPMQTFSSTTAVNGVFKLGDRGLEVKKLQERLVVAGYPIGSPDGIFGPRTEAALQLFQSAYGLQNTGIATKATQEALERKLYVVVIPKRSFATLDAVREVFPDAFEAEHRLGTYIHAGSSLRREVAKTRIQILRDRGLVDARVVYF